MSQSAAEIRPYVLAVENATTPSPELADWKSWALQIADAVDPLIAGDALATSLPRRVEPVSA
ncbi:MAG: hypothetical protein WDN76_08405 [Alphaproteobacteria bacterium]